MAKVSVVMPIYNAEKFLRQALDSVLEQSSADWELIAVNDGSTDASASILGEFPDARLRVISQENGGEASARNTGLDHVQGEYIAFLDSDDFYLPNALKDLSGYLDSHPKVDVVYSDGYICDEQGKKLSRLTEHRPGLYEGNILEPLILDASVVTVPVCTMTRRAAILKSGARFDRSLVIGPDWDFWIQLACQHQFGYLDRQTCMYRVHQTNITRTSGINKRKNDLAAGRLKVMDYPWFDSLSPVTRTNFFYNLVLVLLAGQPERQVGILESERFKKIPVGDQQHLWRLAGTGILKRGERQADAERILARALELFPGVSKTRLILKLTRINPFLARSFVITWDFVYSIFKSIRDFGKVRPKPVPRQLHPTGK